MIQSNGLRYTATKTVGAEVITVNIRLNDECKNGHQDFSITGDIYVAGKPRTDRNHIAGGCIHEEIAKHFPEFIPFIRLHLCDFDGVPMHPVANGFYHLHTGFNSKSTGEAFKAEYCEYYRITPEQFDALNNSKNKTQYGLLLQSLGVLAQWKTEAQAAIKELERLTDKEFINDSKRSQYVPPTPEEIADNEKKIKDGYYTPEAEAARSEAKRQAQFTALEQARDKDIEKATLEYEVKKEVLLKGGPLALEHSIFYNHSKELAFNWRKYGEELSEDFINDLIPQLQLPEGVTAKIAAKK